jgi:hypothetical protein
MAAEWEQDTEVVTAGDMAAAEVPATAEGARGGKIFSTFHPGSEVEGSINKREAAHKVASLFCMLIDIYHDCGLCFLQQHNLCPYERRPESQ